MSRRTQRTPTRRDDEPDLDARVQGVEDALQEQRTLQMCSPRCYHPRCSINTGTRKTVMNLHGNEQKDDVSMKDGGLAADVNHGEKP